MAGKETLEEQIASDKVNLDGAREPLDQLKGMLVQFTPDFQMMPGTKPATPASSVAKDPFEQHPLALTDGGWDTRQVRMAHDGVEPSVGSVGDSYDNAFVETINDLYKTEVIRPLAKPRSRPVRHAGMSGLV